MKWHSIKKEEVLKYFETKEQGLSEGEARKRLEKYGTNELKQVYKVNPVKIFLQQFNSFLIYILLAAAVIALFLGENLDAGVIFAITIINGIIGFVQQYKAEQSIIKLKSLFIPQCKVFRGGKLEIISSKDVVPGDIVEFDQGDKIIADCRILKAENAEVNEAILTGESNSVEKYETLVKEDGTIVERINMIYAGTSIVNGKVIGVVVGTGMSTEFGRIAMKLQEINLDSTPIQKKFDKFAKQVAVIVIILAVLTFLLGIFQGKDHMEMLMTAIVIAVAAIPEGLPAIVTISLAFATNKMLKKKILIRRLPAAETLGSVTIICTDKTGTLTEEKMKVKEVYCNNKFYDYKDSGLIIGNKKVTIREQRDLFQLVKTSILSSNARFEKQDNGGYEIIGDTTESAFVSFALDSEIDKKVMTEQEPRIKEISFSSERRMMSILRKGDRRNVVYSKGAPESIIDRSSFEYGEGDEGIIKLDESRKRQLRVIYQKMEKKGLRVLGFGFKYTQNDVGMEEGLTFLGFMGILDPPRVEIKEAVKECKDAGIKIKMITGDSALTAKAVGEEIGITGRVVEGKELDEMDDQDLINNINEIIIFARIEPKQKLRIVEALKSLNECVAITGDGVNDILALKRADIGVAMGQRGSDVAREVSDMILLDDNFISVVKGVEEGRIVYDNTKKATKFLIASNFGELLLIAASILVNLPLPLLPLHILWINLVTDAFPALALTKEQGEEVMKGQPRKEASILNGILLPVFFASVLFLISSFAILFYGLANYGIEHTRTLVMMTVVGFETLFVFSCKSEKPLYKTGLFGNKYLLYAVGLVILLQAALILTPLSAIFQLTSLSLIDWGFVLLCSLPGVVGFEIWKIVKGRKR